MATITELALDIIMDSSHVSSYDDVLGYLQDEMVFNNVSMQLKRSMVSFKMMSSVDEPTEKFEDVLVDSLRKISKDKRIRKYVTEWFEDNSPINHEWAIKVCFALQQELLKVDPSFDIAESCAMAREFLQKATGVYSFNLRSAEDSTYLFCLLHGKPYSIAEHIIDEYNDKYEAYITEGSSYTVEEGQTVILSNALHGLGWESEEGFLTSFLKPNASLFSGYPLRGATELSNRLSALRRLVLISALEEEQKELSGTVAAICRLAKELKGTQGNLNDFDTKCKEHGLELNLDFSANLVGLLKREKQDDLYNMVRHIKTDYEEINRRPEEILKESEDIVDVWYMLEQRYSDDEDKMASILAGLVPRATLLQRVLANSSEQIIVKDNLAEYSDQFMRIFESFPSKQNMGKVQNKPQDNFFKLSTRKTILLLIFLEYTYGWDPEKSQNELSLREFMAIANESLTNCGLAPLYPAAPFDWLLLKIIKLFEEYDPELLQDDEMDSPQHYFNQLLDLMLEEKGV